MVLIGRGLQLREVFIGLDLGLLDIGRLFFYMMPFFMLMVIPIACMLSVFLTFLRMSSDRELVALKAGGISIYQMLPAPLLFACLCTVLSLVISLEGLSWGMANFRADIMEMASTRARIVLQPGVFNKTIPNVTLFARQVDPIEGALQQVIVEDLSQKDTKLTILAPRGKLVTDELRGEINFELHDGRIYQTAKEQVTVLGFDEYIVRLDLENLFSGLDLGKVKPKEMSWDELVHLDLSEYAKEAGQSYMRKVQVELQKRWALPMACLVLGLFAMPLACAFEGVKRQTGVVTALLMFMVYYTLLSLGMSMGESQTIPPVIGLWFPNVFFAVLAAYGLVLTAKERTPSFSSLVHTLKDRWRKAA